MIPKKFKRIFSSEFQFLITGEFKKASTLKKKLQNITNCENKILVLRVKKLINELSEAVEVAKKFCRKRNIPLILNIPDKFSFNADGYHLSSNEIECDHFTPEKIIGVSCHTEDEVKKATLRNYDYIFLSPVVRKNGVSGMGWQAFLSIKDKYPDKIIVPLGGINESNTMQNSFAGISHWWDPQKSQ